MDLAVIHTIAFVIIMLILAIFGSRDVSKTRHHRTRRRDDTE